MGGRLWIFGYLESMERSGKKKEVQDEDEEEEEENQPQAAAAGIQIPRVL